MSSLWVFPGQGAQQAGMLQPLAGCAIGRQCLLEASAALGENALQLDSVQALQGTRAVQLCLLIAGVAGARVMQAEGSTPDYVAGLSIGAYPAAVVAGALAFDDALALVALRGQLMQDAYPQGYGMTAIIGLEQDAVQALIDEVHSAETPVYLANLNAETQFVIAGSDAAMAEVAQRARVCGAATARRLAVSVPSHCALMQQPAEKLAVAMAKVSLKAPTIRYLSASSARPVMQPEKLRNDLAFNMCRVVDWRSTVQTAVERGVRLHIEMPPGSVLTGLARRVFEHGTAIAFEGARLDTLAALSREEVSRNR